MIVRILRRAMGASVMVLAGLASTAALSDTLMQARLSELLGQEAQSIRMVSDSRLAALTAPPPPDARDVPTAPASLSYNRSFLAALPPANGDAQWECLAEALYFEARSESVRGMFAVGEVILNRVDSAQFPNTICGVVNQGTGRLYACQFTYTCDGHPEQVHEPQSWQRVGKVARLLIDGAPRELTDGATHYHTRAVSPRWARTFPRVATVGSHYFYRMNG